MRFITFPLKSSNLLNSSRRMATVVLVSALSASFGWSASALAEVKAPGTVMENMCADARETNPRAGGWTITRVCTASIVGELAPGQGLKQYVVVSESRVASRVAYHRQMVYEVTAEQISKTRGGQIHKMDLLHIGSVGAQGLFEAKMTADYVVGEIRIRTSARTGRTSARGLVDQRSFQAGDFEAIFHTMSIGFPQ